MPSGHDGSLGEPVGAGEEAVASSQSKCCYHVTRLKGRSSMIEEVVHWLCLSYLQLSL